jgi:hypothetical protein
MSQEPKNVTEKTKQVILSRPQSGIELYAQVTRIAEKGNSSNLIP